MPIVATIPRHSYTATAGQTSFPYAFPVAAASELRVYVDNTLKTLTVDYTVDGIGSPTGGNVVLLTPATVGTHVVILGQVPLSQDTDYQDHGPFPAAAHEGALDKLTRITQQLQEQLTRAPLLKPSTGMAPVELPDPSSLVTTQGGKKAIVYNDDGTNLSLIELVNQIGLVGDVIPAVANAAALPAPGVQGRMRKVNDTGQFALDAVSSWLLFTQGNQLIMPSATRATLPPAGANAGKSYYLTDPPQATAVSDGVTWQEFPVGGMATLTEASVGALPPVAPAGQQRRITNKHQGLAISNGAVWYGINAPVYRADYYVGSGIAQKIQAAHDAMPATGGTIDVRALEGDQTWTQTVTFTKPVRLLLGASTITVTATPGLLTTGAAKLALVGPAVWGTTLISALTNMELIKHTAEAQFSAENLIIGRSVPQGLGTYISLVPPNLTSSHSIRRCSFDGGYIAVLIGKANSIHIDHCGFVNSVSAGIVLSFMGDAAFDAGQCKVTNCDFDHGDRANNMAACIIVKDASGLYVENCTMIYHAYGVLLQVSENYGFNEFFFYNNRLSHHRFYNLIAQRLSGTGSLNGIEVIDNAMSSMSAEFVASISLQTPAVNFAFSCKIQGNTLNLSSAGDIGCEILGGTSTTIQGNVFTAGHPSAIAIGTSTTPDLDIGPNTYRGFASNGSVVSPNLANVRYTPSLISGSVTVDPPSINAGQVGFVDVTITGIQATHPDMLILRPPFDLESGLIYLNYLIVSDNIVRLFIYNVSGGAVNGLPRTWTYLWFDHVR